MEVILGITDEQRTVLEPIFDRLHEVNDAGEGGAIVGQIYPDGMLIKCISGGEAQALRDALGGSGEIDTSLCQRQAGRRNAERS